MNDAQTWTSIGGLLTVLLAFVGLVFRMLSMMLDARLETIDHKFESFNHRFESFETKIEAKMDAGFARLERRIDGLDRDVNTLARRFLDGP